MKIIKLLLKYFTLILLFGLIIYLTKFYGNYCGDLYVQMVFVPFFGILLLINIAVLYIVDFKRKKYKTTNRIVLFLFLLLMINFLIGYLESNRVSEYTLEPNAEYNMFKIELFKNNDYQLRRQYNHGDCTYAGEYTFENGILIFKNSVITKQSENLITTKYRYDSSKKIFKSLNSNFKDLIIVSE